MAYIFDVISAIDKILSIDFDDLVGSVKRIEEAQNAQGLMLNQLIQQGISIMQGTADLVNIHHQLRDKIAEVGARMDANFQKLMDALNNSTIPAAEQAIIDQVTGEMQADISTLNAIEARDTVPVSPAP